MSPRRVSHSLLDPHIGPVLASLYPRLKIPRRFPPEGIVACGHFMAAVGGFGFACSVDYVWGGALAAIGVAGNHLCDCVDGTHARATDQCRNGGELLDHFTDPLSFSYWMIGLAIATSAWPWAVVAVLLIMAMAVLTNIRAKMLGEFRLERIGPTEFKAFLFATGVVIAGVQLVGMTSVLPSGSVASWAVARGVLVGLVAVGAWKLPWSLAKSVSEVNRDGGEVDREPWTLATRLQQNAEGRDPSERADRTYNASEPGTREWSGAGSV